jgi:hypothetical protein
MGLLVQTPEAVAWQNKNVDFHRAEGHFGEVRGGVVWSSAKDADGNLIVDIDPQVLVNEIKLDKFPLLLQHDPGHPLGKILDAELFIARSGEQFVAAVMGFYAGRRISFADLATDVSAPYEELAQLPELPSDYRIDIVVDLREISEGWLKAVVTDAELPVRIVAASYNAKDSNAQLIRVGVLFVTVAWNPLVTTIATEAGKDIYAAAKHTLERVVDRMSDLANPILEIKSHHDDCQISFILRGVARATNREAMGKIASAASAAEFLLSRMKAQGKSPKNLVYEYDRTIGNWFPSYAELADGTFITDNEKLYAVQELPDGLSLGLTSSRNRP